MKRYLSVAFVVLFLLAEKPSKACIQREREALLKLKSSFHGPSNRLSSWEGNHCCQWEGIACDNVTSHVVKLDLKTSELPLKAQNLDVSLLQLEYLSYLDLNGNDFSCSPIPMFIGSMRRLSYLSLSDTSFCGTIPSTIGNLTNLYHLDLHCNFVVNLYTNNINWISQLWSMEYLDISGVDLDGKTNLFQVLSMLPSLSTLYMDSCELGNLTTSFLNLTSTPQLQFLSLQGNELTNSFLDALQNMTYLVHLDLSINNLTSLPSWLSQLTDLKYLKISRNQLHGNIPNNFHHLVNLIYLDLSSNKLDGMIPVMHELWFMNLSYNHISGSLPQNIGNKMPYLAHLFLRSNLINGSIPNSLCQLELWNLDLSDNKISGVIPNCWSKTNLCQDINLSSNKLSGVFPTSFGNLFLLLWLHLNNNKLQGQLPMNISSLSQLLILDLGENQFSGRIPSWSFYSLQILRLSKNKLNGSIPSELCQLRSLKILDLSRNNLVGSIPKCIGNIRGMTIENSYEPLSQLVMFTGYNYSFSGWVYEEVKQVMKGREDDYIKILEFVVNMDLSENKLVGFIPDGITSLTRLHGLNLSHNCLEGEIPKMIGDMESLESFDVSYNQLSGHIPNNMISLTYLSHLNLSHNNFSGPIPQGYQFSTYDPDDFADNPYLCGPPLLKCPSKDSHEVSGRGFEDEDGKEDRLEKLLLYSFIALGFATGFWGIIVVLLVKKSFRYACFRWVEDATDMVYVEVVIKVARIKKWLVRNHVQG